MIVASDLSKTFPSPGGEASRTVLSGFSLTVPDGTFLGISGASGVGKSTLLSILAGVQRPTSGTVSMDGTDLFSLGDKELSAFRNGHIGFVSQEQSFIPSLTVYDNVRLPYFLGVRRSRTEREAVGKRAMELLDALGIRHLSGLFPPVLSGGENDRVLIARALINEPSVILADEPTDSVDEAATDRITEIFKELSAKGKTVILVSHDRSALKKCDDVVSLS